MDYNAFSKKNNVSATGILIIINVIVYILSLPYFDKSALLLRLGTLWIGNPQDFNQNNGIIYTVNTGAYWQLLTSMFLHDPRSFFHIFFNMYALYLFGKPLEDRWGKLKFLLFYLGTGILANIASSLFYNYIIKTPIAMIGASGAIYGVLLAFGGYYPDLVLLLFFVIPMKTKWAIVLFAGLSIFFQLTGSFGGIAHITHLFGFISGYLILLIFFRFNAIKEMFFKKKDYFSYK